MRMVPMRRRSRSESCQMVSSGVGAVAVQGEEIGVADVILADLLDEESAVEPEGADLTVAGRALHAEGDAAVGEIRLHELR